MKKEQKAKLQSRAWELAREMQATAGHALHGIAAWDSTPESIAAAINGMTEKAAQVARHFNTALLDTIGQDIRDDSGETAGAARAAPSSAGGEPAGATPRPAPQPVEACVVCGADLLISIFPHPDGQRYCPVHYPPAHNERCETCGAEVPKDDFHRDNGGGYHCGKHHERRAAVEEPEPQAAGAPTARPGEKPGEDGGLAA